MINVVIADDHPLLRAGVKKIIQDHADMTVCAETGGLSELLDLLAKRQPDVLVLDLSFPEADGVEALLRVHKRHPDLPILVLSMHPEGASAIRALQCGARGYVSKTMATDEVVEAIRKVHAGGRYVSPRLAELLAYEVQQPATQPPHFQLTEREGQILRLLGGGASIKQVAAHLNLSISSVTTYRNRIFKKMQLNTSTALVRYAIAHGLAE